MCSPFPLPSCIYIAGKPYDKAVDWWALGTFIYEMLSGWPPYFDEVCLLVFFPPQSLVEVELTWRRCSRLSSQQDPKRMNKMILLEPLTFEPSLFPSHAQSLIAGLLNRFVSAQWLCVVSCPALRAVRRSTNAFIKQGP
jgi:serine/threonine protein kinase